MRAPLERLRDIAQAIENVMRYADRGKGALERDELIQTWMVHQLQIIGEAAHALPIPVREMSPSVPWSNIIGMRNVLVHGYFDIDTDLVWSTITQDLPQLRDSIAELISTISLENPGEGTTP